MNGERTLFWVDKWLDDQCMSDQCVRMVTEEERLFAVAGYWRESGGWKWDLIGGILPASVLVRLAGIGLSLITEEEDDAGWLTPENKSFTVKSAYDLLTGRSAGEVWKGWKRIQCLKVQEHTKVFLWILAHDRTMTNWTR